MAFVVSFYHKIVLLDTLKINCFDLSTVPYILTWIDASMIFSYNKISSYLLINNKDPELDPDP